MAIIVKRKTKFALRLNRFAASEKPLREVVGNLSKVAKYAIEEAKSLSLERVEVKLGRLPKKLTACGSFISLIFITARSPISSTSNVR